MNDFQRTYLHTTAHTARLMCTRWYTRNMMKKLHEILAGKKKPNVNLFVRRAVVARTADWPADVRVAFWVFSNRFWRETEFRKNATVTHRAYKITTAYKYRVYVRTHKRRIIGGDRHTTVWVS